MLYWAEYKGHSKKLVGKRKVIDNNVYTFDIETSSYLILNGKQIDGCKYEDLTEDDKEQAEFRATMYIWMFSINEQVYYGRTWQELKQFLYKIEQYVPEQKYLFIHNLAYEFQFLKSEFSFKNVMARKAHKVMKCELANYNFELRCSYFMSNCSLEQLAKVYKLEVNKKVGDLDYTKMRHYKTPLTKKELEYCENDCFVVYYYILEELKTYLTVNKIPFTSTRTRTKRIKRYCFKRLGL